MPKLCPKIIVEGTRLTGKTDLVLALSEHPRLVGPRRYRYHTPFVSAEWSGFTPEPWGRGLINFEPSETLRAIETYRAWVRLMELLPHDAWFVDRFHLATRAWQEARGGSGLGGALPPVLDGALDEVDRRLAALGFVCVLCVREESTFEAARAERLKVSGKPSQYDDLGAIVREQSRLGELARASRLPVLEIEPGGVGTAPAADRVAAWWHQIRGASGER